jgi:hypothetical protein
VKIFRLFKYLNVMVNVGTDAKKTKNIRTKNKTINPVKNLQSTSQLPSVAMEVLVAVADWLKQEQPTND